MPKIVIAKNTTASGISLGDLSGATIPASGTRNLSEQFEFSRIANALDLRDYITASGIVINDGMEDLPVGHALRYISYDDATSVQNIPIADPSEEDLEDGFTMRYDEGEIAFDFDTFRFSDLAEITIIGGTYYVTNASGVSIPLNQKFWELGDTPATYSGAAGKYLRVGTTESGVEFVDASEVDGIAGHAYGDSESESSTTSTTYQQKLRISPTIESGTYILLWSYEWQYKDGSFRFKGRIQIDDSSEIMNHEEQPTTVSSWAPASGFKRLSLDSGTYNIDLDFCSSKSGKEAKIRRVRLEFWRV